MLWGMNGGFNCPMALLRFASTSQAKGRWLRGEDRLVVGCASSMCGEVVGVSCFGCFGVPMYAGGWLETGRWVVWTVGY